MKSIILISLSFWSGMAAAQFVERPAQEEYEIRRQYLKERDADYYSRLNELDRRDENQKEIAEDSKKERRRLAEEFDKARKEYIKNRKPKTPTQERAFMDEIRLLNKQRDQNRKDYVQRRKDLQRMLRSLATFPEEEELGIDLNYDADYYQ